MWPTFLSWLQVRNIKTLHYVLCMIIPKIQYNFTTLLTAVIIGHFQIWNYEID